MTAKEAEDMTTSLAEKLVPQGRREGEEKGRAEGIILS
jgi:hypothetical protein